MTKIDTRSRGGTRLRCTQTDRLSGVHRLQRRTRAVAVLRPSAGCRRHSSVQHAAKQEGADGEAGQQQSQPTAAGCAAALPLPLLQADD